MGHERHAGDEGKPSRTIEPERATYEAFPKRATSTQRKTEISTSDLQWSGPTTGSGSRQEWE